MIKTIYLAGGCFWGTAHLFSLVPGVSSTTAGYANSIVENPTYKEVCTGNTHAAETVKVEYDPDCVSLTSLLTLYFKSIDPLSLNKQGETPAHNTAPASISPTRPTHLWSRQILQPSSVATNSRWP